MESSLIAILSIIVSVLTALFGVIFKRLNDMDERLRRVPNREEVDQKIEDKLESVKVLQHEIKEDIKEIKDALRHLASK